jgi:hypothetical protein
VAGDSLCIELPEWIEVIGVSGGACIATGTGGRGEASVLLGRVCDDSAESADSSSTGGTCVLTGRLFFAADPEGGRERVSILSCFAFCPDRRRSLTPGPGEPPKLGGRGGGNDGAGGTGGVGLEVGGRGRAPPGGGWGGGTF